MKKKITATIVGLACLAGLASFEANAAQVNTGQGARLNNVGYCLFTGEERVSQANCPLGQNRLLSTQGGELTSEQTFLLAAARQRPQDGPGYKNGRNGGTGQNDGTGKQDGSGPGCVDGPRVAYCPYWEEKQDGATDTTSGTAPTDSTQANTAQTSTDETNATQAQVYGQQPQDGTGNQYGAGNGNAANNANGQGNQTNSANRGYGNGVCDGSGGGAGRNAGNGLRDGSGAGGQRGRNAGNCVVN